MKTARGTVEEAIKAAISQEPQQSDLNQSLQMLTPNKPPAITVPSDVSQGGWNMATATAYSGKEAGDPYGDTTARPNMFGVSKAIEGTTIASDPSIIPYGSHVEVMDKNGNVKMYFNHDTGGDVKKRVASIGRKNFDAQGQPLPVIDFFTKGDPNVVNDQIGNVIKYRIVPDTTLASR